MMKSYNIASSASSSSCCSGLGSLAIASDDQYPPAQERRRSSSYESNNSRAPANTAAASSMLFSGSGKLGVSTPTIETSSDCSDISSTDKQQQGGCCEKEEEDGVFTIIEDEKTNVQMAFLKSMQFKGVRVKLPGTPGGELELHNATPHKLRAYIDTLNEQKRKLLEKSAVAWLQRNRDDAKTMAGAHANLAVVGSLIFSVSATSFIRTSDNWYSDAMEDGQSSEAAAFGFLMALACTFSAWGLRMAIMRTWSLKRLSVVEPTALEKFMYKSTVHRTIEFEEAFIWGAVGICLAGLACFSVSINAEDKQLSNAYVIIFMVGVALSVGQLVVGIARYLIAVSRKEQVELLDYLHGKKIHAKKFPMFVIVVAAVGTLVAALLATVLLR